MVESHGMGGGSPPTDEIEVITGPGATPDEFDDGGADPGVGYDGGRGSPVEVELCRGSSGSESVGSEVEEEVLPAACLFALALALGRGRSAPVASALWTWGGSAQGNQSDHPDAESSERLEVVTVTVTVASRSVAAVARRSAGAAGPRRGSSS